MQKTITNKIKLAEYQRVAKDVKANVNDILDMEDQVLFLAKEGIGVNGNIQYAQNLQARIQNNAATDLLNIWDGVEGDTTLGFPGLIEMWSDLVGAGRGAPIFTDNKYLKRAVPQEEYFFGVGAIGLNLEMELAHSLEPAFPTLAKRIIKDNYDAFNRHHDVEMKLVAHNRDIGGLGFFAARILPDILDNYTIDTRSGLLWSRNKASGSLFQAYPSNPPTGWETIAEHIDKINREFYGWWQGQHFPGESASVVFDAPTREEWRTLTTGARETAAEKKMTANVWLTSQGFEVNYLGSTRYSFWTSDIARNTGDSKTFPNWDNWVIDLYASPGGVVWYLVNNNPNDPIKIAHLMLVSNAALNPASWIRRFFYRTGADVFPLK